MSRLKLLAAAMLLALPIISACGDDVPPPPPTGSIDGLVSIEGQGIDGVSVTLSNGATVTTANGGMFRFDGVEAGAYTVTISNTPDDASFNQTSAAATIATDGENVTVNFPGTWIRTAAIMGTVTVENEGLSGVTVKLSGMSDSETLTDGSGQYAFSGLRAGNYTVQISGFDEEDVAFGSTQSTAAVAVGESKVVTFEGTYLRASAITGQVTVEDNPLEGVTVSLQGKGEDRTATTNGAGQFTFSELRRGDYSVGITNPDADEYSFEVTSRTITIAHGETASASFEGVLLRTASIIGTVTVENVGGIPDVMVTIQGGEKGQELTATTNDAGQFSFTQLYAGDYSVGISGFDDDLYGFDVTTATITVERKATATVKPFEGIELRTAGIAGTVTVEGHPIPGVTVTITGGPKDEEHETMTNDVGYYLVDELHAGDYAVAISDFDTNEYEFEATTQSISVGLRETATVAFQGDLLRTAGISGRVSVEGVGLDGITVTLSSDDADDMTAMTADGGQYAFTGLAEGDYTVTIEGWDEAAYSFDMTSADLEVMQDASVIQNFEGMHTRTASVSGYLFLDEVDANGMHDEGEPPLAMTAEMMAALAAAKIPGVPLLLQGPGVNDVQYGFAMADGSYAFEGLMAGSYRVLINMTDELAAAITGFGFRFSGELTGQVINVAAAEAAMVNFPFRIVMQTIVAGAVLGYADVAEHGLPMAGVTLELYPNADDAANGMNMLGMATTDSVGVAVFHFARAMDTGPGGHGTDHLVFIKYKGSALPNIVPSDNEDIEIAYASTDRVSMAPTVVRVLNVMANFQWWVKSDEMAKDGNETLEGWTATNGMETNEDGLAIYSGLVAMEDLPKTFEVELAEDDQPDMGEVWSQSAKLTHMHTGLEHPALNLPAANDLGPVYVTYETQTLVLGVYRETDDEDGFTNYVSPVPGGDHRPASAVGAEMTVELMVRDERNRLKTLEYDHDLKAATDPIEARGNFGKGGLLRFAHLPADEEITVRFRMGSSDRVLVSYDPDIETFGDDLDLGSSVGAFGEMSGAGPEVRVCAASAGTSDDECATYGYQWKTGTISGKVGLHNGNDISVEPTTGQGATGKSDTTHTGGTYRLSGLQDGTYDATATNNNANYSLNGTPTMKGLELYHDEPAWVEANKDDEDDIEYDGAEETATWGVTRIGLKIMGYVGNDNGDQLMRGDESIADVTITLNTGMKLDKNGLYSGGTFVAETETDAAGLYVFENLRAGVEYDIVASSGTGYSAVRHLLKNGGVVIDVAAQNYPALPSEGTYALPGWDYMTRTSSNDEVTIANTAGTVSGVLQNFALVYSDGSISGSVNNVSGSNNNIDVRISSDVFSGVMERATNTAGRFSVTGVLEGTYSALIEDAGFAVPCMSDTISGGVPDDDGPLYNHDDDDTTPNECRRAATTISGDTRGRQDHASMGTLHVYSSTMRDVDDMTGVTVKGVTTAGDSAVFLGDAGTITTADDDSTDVTGISGTILFAAKTVTLTPTLMDALPGGASASAMVEGGSACPGLVCTLLYNATGAATGAGTARANVIRVMVKAQNGYDDHLYKIAGVERAAPRNNVIEAAAITGGGTSGTDAATGTGTLSDPFTTTTASATATSVVMTIGLAELGTGDDAYCTQSVSVKVYNGDDVDAEADTEEDGCSAGEDNEDNEGEQYEFSVDTLYQLTVMSEDDVPATYYLTVTAGS